MSVRKRHVWRLLAVAGAGFGIYVWRQRELIRLIRQGLRLYPDKRPEFAAIMQRLVWAVTEGSVFARSYPLAHRDIRYGAHSRQRLDLFQPPGAAGCPLLFFVHGGGWESGRKELYSSVAREFTSLGYVVVIINYRLAPQVSFPVFVADAAAALRWTVDNVTAYGGDRGAIVLAGHSAGAHIVSLLGLDERFLGEQGVDLGVIRGVVGMSGPYDLPALLEHAGKAVDWKLVEGHLTVIMGSPEQLEVASPLRYVHPGAPPFLLLHGREDRLVPVQQAEVMAAALQEVRVPVRLRVLERTNHFSIVLNLFGRQPESPTSVVQEIDQFAQSEP